MAKKAYLTKVLVQTFWVVVDDETEEVKEFSDTGVAVPAADWPTFYKHHTADFEGIKFQVSKESESPDQDGKASK